MKDLTIHPQSEDRSVELAVLYLHDLNPRRDVVPADIDQLAESIQMCGLMQNLLGFDDPDHPGTIGIVAGGRRLRALQLLAQRGEDIPPIPVQVTGDPMIAEAWASAENTSHIPPHPADEIRAYGRMRVAGAQVPTIARAFAVPEHHVVRRLKLAQLPSEVMDALRADRINLSEAAALTTAPDDDKALAVLDACQGKDWGAHRIKAELHTGRVRGSDRRAIFVGLDSFVEAGGDVNHDLFSEDTWLSDVALLDRLFDEKLITEALRHHVDEGWAFAWHTTKTHPWDEKCMRETDQSHPDPVDLPDGDAAELETLSELGHWQQTKEQRARVKELEARARGSFDETARAELGVMLYVNHEGEMKVIDGLRHRRAPTSDKTDTIDAEINAPEPAREPVGISAPLQTDLHAIRLAALQHAMKAKTELVLDLLTYHLVEGSGHYPRIFELGHTLPIITPSVTDGLLTHSEKSEAPEFHEIDAERFGDLQSAGKKARNEWLAGELARRINHRADPFMAEMERLCGADVRKIWTPSTSNFFGRVKGGYLDAVYTNLLTPEDDDPHWTAFAALKVKQKAKELGDLFSDASVQEAYGLDRATIARIDAWVPVEMGIEVES